MESGILRALYNLMPFVIPTGLVTQMIVALHLDLLCS